MELNLILEAWRWRSWGPMAGELWCTVCSFYRYYYVDFAFTMIPLWNSCTLQFTHLWLWLTNSIMYKMIDFDDWGRDWRKTHGWWNLGSCLFTHIMRMTLLSLWYHYGISIFTYLWNLHPILTIILIINGDIKWKCKSIDNWNDCRVLVRAADSRLQSLRSCGHHIMESVCRCQMQVTVCSAASSAQVSLLLGQL